MRLDKVKVLDIYSIEDVTNKYSEYSDEKKRKYRSAFVDDMILYEPLYKVVCRIECNNKVEIVTKVWRKSELKLIKKNQYYLA